MVGSDSCWRGKWDVEARRWSLLSTNSFSFVFHFPFSTEPWSFERKGSWCSLIAKKHFVPKLMECKYWKCNQACEVPKITQFPVPFVIFVSEMLIGSVMIGHVRSSPASRLFVEKYQLSNEKKPWLFRVYIGDAILPSYVGIIVNHSKDPYKPTRIRSWGSRLIPVIQQQHWMIWDGYRSSMDYFWEWVHDQPSVKSRWFFAYTCTNYRIV